MNEILAPFRQKQTLARSGSVPVFIGMAVPFSDVSDRGLYRISSVNAVPVVVGLLLSPAGAWGCAIGNNRRSFGTFQGVPLGVYRELLAAYRISSGIPSRTGKAQR